MDLLAEAASRNDWPIVVTAIGAILGPFIALMAMVYEGRRTRDQLEIEASRMRLQLGVDNMWKLIEKWEGPATHRSRAEAAAHLLSNWERRSELPNSALDVLDLFELLAYLVIRSKTLSLEDAWINFSGHAISWWHVSRPGIEAFQRNDHTLYEDFASLADQLMTLEAERRGETREALVPREKDLIDYLLGEKKLVNAPWWRRR